MTRLKSIFGFQPLPVTLLTVITYISLFTALLVVDRNPPEVAGKREQDSWGVDVEEAWSDLEELTREFRPYNSRRNDEVRDFLLDRIRTILGENGVEEFMADGSLRMEERYPGKVELIDDGPVGETGSNVTTSRGDLTVGCSVEEINVCR
jgi:hypothetical protein